MVACVLGQDLTDVKFSDSECLRCVHSKAFQTNEVPLR